MRKNYRCTAGDCFLLSLPEAEEVPLVPQDIPLDVVYEDGDVIVVNKPRGLVVHPAPGHPDGTLVNALLFHCGDSLSGIGGEKRPGIVHRIDKDTSGLLIVAKNDFAHQALSAQLADRSLSRVYEAVVRGNLREDTGTVDRPIGRHPHGPQAHGRPPRRPSRRDPLGGPGPLPGLYPHPLPPGDRAAPTRSGSTWQAWAIPCWGISPTARPPRRRAWRASASTPGS